MKPTYYPMLLALLLICCTPIKNLKNKNSFIPSLGAVGKNNTSVLGKNFQQLGAPHIAEPLALSVREVQFSKSMFKTYQAFKENQGAKPVIMYSDSVTVKPKYLSLEILDKVSLQSQLNNDGNKAVREYLTQDDGYALISQISFLATSEIKDHFRTAKSIFLVENSNGSLEIKILNGKEKKVLNFLDIKIFEYDVSGFCWGKDRYGQLKIKAITNKTDKCPKGTEKKAYKLNDTKSYLKF